MYPFGVEWKSRTSLTSVYKDSEFIKSAAGMFLTIPHAPKRMGINHDLTVLIGIQNQLEPVPSTSAPGNHGTCVKFVWVYFISVHLVVASIDQLQLRRDVRDAQRRRVQARRSSTSTP
ncbi:hypothetical protein JTB14_007974 [Gonioctena quinquepunctata]|nr:hypothetical protein JTB14_007974 [Gonioctena quinquepunctata]